MNRSFLWKLEGNSLLEIVVYAHRDIRLNHDLSIGLGGGRGDLVGNNLHRSDA